MLPVPRREDAVVHRRPRQAVLPLLRLRSARHRGRLPDGTTPTWSSSRRWRSSPAGPGARYPAKAAVNAGRTRTSSRSSSRWKGPMRTSSDSSAATRGHRGRWSTSRDAAFREGSRPNSSSGFAPPGRDGVLRELGIDDSARATLVRAGLLVERDGDRPYDRFRDRIIFPSTMPGGRVAGFGARIIDSGEPKYLNSPETPVFRKGRELYGLWRARRAGRSPAAAARGGGLHGRGGARAVGDRLRGGNPRHRRDRSPRPASVRAVNDVVFCFDRRRGGPARGMARGWRTRFRR